MSNASRNSCRNEPNSEQDDVADALERESIQSSPEESGLPPPERTGPGSEARM